MLVTVEYAGVKVPEVLRSQKYSGDIQNMPCPVFLHLQLTLSSYFIQQSDVIK